MCRMNLGMYDAAVECVRAEAWADLWEDSFIWGGERIRDLLVCDGAEVYPRDEAAESLLSVVLVEIFSGV